MATEKTEIVVGDSGRIIFGTCSCAFFQDNLLGKGPCEHMLALFKASADGRKDLPTSTASSASASVKLSSAGEDGGSEDEVEEENVDEDQEEGKQ